METSPSKRAFLEWVLEVLWTQWTSLGVSGSDLSKHKPIEYVIDPEALLLLTTSFGRYDPRLFDEVLDWLFTNGKLINIQRLLNLKRDHPALGNDSILVAMSEVLSGKSTLNKWKSLFKNTRKNDSQDAPEALFLGVDQQPLPLFGEADPLFKRHGLLRSPYKESGKSRRPNPDLSANLLLKLRALFGVDARAEVLTFLLTHASSFPAEVARETAYFKKTIQDCLNEIELSGHIKSFAKGKEKHFQINEKDWNFLRTWESKSTPKWLNWAEFFTLLGEVWLLENDARWTHADLLLKRVEVDKILSKYQGFLTKAGVGSLSRDVQTMSILALLQNSHLGV